jgi:hypothetical protein
MQNHMSSNAFTGRIEQPTEGEMPKDLAEVMAQVWNQADKLPAQIL